MAYAWAVVVLAHIAGLPVQESLAYIAPAVVVVGWIYWAGRRERRRGEHAAEHSASDIDLDAVLGSEPTGDPPLASDPRPASTVTSAGHRRAL